MATKPIDPFAERLVTFLDELGVPHSELRFRGGCDGQVFDLHHSIQIEENMFYYEMSGNVLRHMLTVWTFPLLKIPANRLVAVAEYAARANFGLWYGGFDMEYCPDGRIGFKTSLCCEGIEPGFAMLRDWLHTSFIRIYSHAPYIQKVIAGEASAAEALQAMEEESRTIP